LAKVSKFWLFFGVALVCSGYGTAIGALMLFFYFWDDIKTTILQNRGPVDAQKHYDDQVLDDMK